MQTSGSGGKREEIRRVAINFVGRDEEFIALIDALELTYQGLRQRGAMETAAAVVQEITRQVNWQAGTMVNHPAPSGEIHVLPQAKCEFCGGHGKRAEWDGPARTYRTVNCDNCGSTGYVLTRG